MADNTIHLKGDFIRKELPAGGTIRPGDLVERTSTGTYIKQAVGTDPAMAAFAVEDELQGNGIADSYATNDRVQVNYPVKGGEVMAWLEASQNVAIGDFLEAAGAGNLQAVSVVSGSDNDRTPIAVALEASNVGADARLKVEIF